MEQNVYRIEGDPLVYLRVNDRWYYYDPRTKPLGEGAMGVVYLGYDCDSNQRVAVKCVRSAYANNPVIRQRVRQEASLSFSHPNIVEMLGLCEYQEGSGPMYVISKYVSGVTLGDHVRQLDHLGRHERAEKISCEICCVLEALEHLHSFGIVHRDIKPSNLMIENGGVVKLMDLGIARLNGGNRYSSYGFIGTPQFAAPEQILRGESGADVKPTADLYSLGLTCYVLLTGKNPMSSTIESEILSNQVTKKLPYDKAIPRRLFKVIQKATEKNPADRYQSAYEFKKAIQQAVIQPDCSAIRLWADDHKILSIILTVALLAMIIIIISLILQ